MVKRPFEDGHGANKSRVENKVNVLLREMSYLDGLPNLSSATTVSSLWQEKRGFTSRDRGGQELGSVGLSLAKTQVGPWNTKNESPMGPAEEVLCEMCGSRSVLKLHWFGLGNSLFFVYALYTQVCDNFI